MEKLEQLWTAISSQEDKLDSEATAKQLDEADPLHSLRKEFLFPTRKTIGATLAPHGS